MSLRPGSRVGHYDVLELLGEGGMGVVFRARDQRLGRDVALKLIHADLAADPDRLARFEREARLLASLSHPNIATIHGLEDADGEHMLVMELVPGETLAERIAVDPLQTREALSIAAQIAAAIEAAHAHDIVHRDLKPANIKLMPDGRVKVLDFGLAKALGESVAPVSHAPTVTSRGTGVGTILGTAAYMSPEQARGKDVDTRSDIWAFGCVLYEMLSGRSPFGGETVSDSVAAILTRDPDWSLFPANVPASIERLARHCLAKDARHRLRDIGDARLELEDALQGSDVGTAAEASRSGAQLRTSQQPMVPVRVASRMAVPLVLAFVAGLLTGVAALWFRAPSSTAAARPLVRFGIQLPEPERLAGLDFPAVAISPNDSHIAYVATRGGIQQLFVRALSDTESVPLAGTEDALSPFFSPDGRWIGFFSGGKLKKVPTTGGTVRVLADAPIGFGGSWGPDDMIVFAPNNGSAIWQVSAQGGAAHPVSTLDTSHGEFSHRWPEWLPDGKSVLFSVGTRGRWDDAEIVVQSIATGKRQSVVEGGSDPHYTADHRVLFVHAGSILAVPLDTKPHASAEATAVLDGVGQSLDGAAHFATSRAGSLVYVPGSGEPGSRTLVWVDRAGGVQPLAAPRRMYSSPRISADGRTIAVAIDTNDRDEVWTYDVARNALTEVTYNGGFAPTWSSDGSSIIFGSTREGQTAVYSRRLGAADSDVRVARSVRNQVPGSMSPDGTLALVESDAKGRDIAFLRSGDTDAHPFLASAAEEMAPAFSPDGRWLAFVHDGSGRNEVYVTSASDPSSRLQVSASGGSEPVWRRDGTELFFRSGTRMMVVQVRTRPSLAVGPPTMLFEGAFEPGTGARPGYDVSADGARLLMIQGDQEQAPARDLRVVLGWADQFRRAAR